MRSSLARRVPIPVRLLVTLGVPLLALVGVLGAQVQEARDQGARARLGVAQATVLQAMAKLQASVTQPETVRNGLTPSAMRPGDIAGQLLISQVLDVVNAETVTAIREIQKVLQANPGVASASTVEAIRTEIAALQPVLAGDIGGKRVAALATSRIAVDDALTDTYLAAGTDSPWVYQGVIELNRTTLAEFSASITTLAGIGRVDAGEMSALSGQRANAVNRTRYGVGAATRAKINAVLAGPAYQNYAKSGQLAAQVAAGRAKSMSPLLLAPVAVNAITLRSQMDGISKTVMAQLLTDLQRRAETADADEKRGLVIAGVVVLLTVLLAIGALRSITGPLRRLTDRAAELAAGRLDGEPVPVVGSDELTRLSIALEGAASTLLHVNAQAEAMAEGRLDDPSLAQAAPGALGEILHENVIAVQASANRLRHAADHDPLTGLLNRAGLDNSLDAGIGHWLLYLDLDGFKQVNDVHGHDQGDDVLRAVAERLLRLLRPGDLACRLGGDEFVVVLHSAPRAPLAEGEECTDPDDLVSLGEIQHAERTQAQIEAAVCRPIRIRMSDRSDLAVDHVQVGASIGRARMPAGGSLEGALAEADAGMYREKRDRKARQAGPAQIGPGFGVPSPAGELRP